MKISRKAWLSTIAVSAAALGVLGANSAVNAETYSGTIYVAAMGGHFAKAEVTIDPSKEQPIILKSLDKIDIGSRADHPTHDARIDADDRNTMFWSTYKIDKETGKVYVGKSDLRTGEKIKEAAVDADPKATNTKSMYCASAQSKAYFLPITMTSKAYIDVFNKSDLKLHKRVFLEGTEGDIGKPYKFYHGVNSPDMKKLLLTINEADKDHGKTFGKVHYVEFDMDEFVNGNVKVTNKGLATGGDGTITFRLTYSPDGSMVASSAADRMFLLDAKTLDVLDSEPVGNLEQNHDAMFTPDSRYVVATSRTKQPGPECADPKSPKEGEFTMDGQLKLYDVQAKKWVGKPTSVCLACHTKEGVEEHAILCGLDANWNN